MDPLQIREAEIFKMLKNLGKLEFVVIGGYAVNAYALPRFSVDCDIVIENRLTLDRISKILIKQEYSKKSTDNGNKLENFERYERKIQEDFAVSLDILIREVKDRQTGVTIPSDWIFKNSEIRTLRGKTITERLKVRIINIDALFVMKMISCRQTDIRDMFMLSPMLKDKKWVKSEITARYNFQDRFEKAMKTIKSMDFRNGLQGVYGLIEDSIFERNVKAMGSLGK